MTDSKDRVNAYFRQLRASRARFWFVGVLFFVLMALTHGGAELKAWLEPAHRAGLTRVVHYRVIFTIWATIILLTPALCFHIFSRSNAPNSYWRAFWTFAIWRSCAPVLGGVRHLPWRHLCRFPQPGRRGDRSRENRRSTRPRFLPGRVVGVGRYFVVAGLGQHKWVRVQRGAVHLLAFVMFFGAAVLAAKPASWPLSSASS